MVIDLGSKLGVGQRSFQSLAEWNEKCGSEFFLVSLK